MKLVNRLISVFTVLALTFASHSVLAESAGRPNIIFILADDIGYGDWSCYGATKQTTPQIERRDKPPPDTVLLRDGGNATRFFKEE